MTFRRPNLPRRLFVSLLSALALCASLIVQLPIETASAQTRGRGTVPQPAPVQAPAPQRAESAYTKGEAPAAKSGVTPDAEVLPEEEPETEALTAVSYPFSTATGVALEDMSSGTTTLIGVSSDDGNSAAVSIGFEFWYDGVRTTQFGVNANGFARLTSAPTGTSFTNTLATTTNAPKIAPFWDDLCTGANGKVHSKVVGSAPNRKLVVEWQNMQITRGAGCAGNGTGTFQMWLSETTGVIQFVYGSGLTGSLDGGYSVGLQSGAATNIAAVTTSTNTVSYVTANDTQATAIAAGRSYIFTPQTAVAPSGLNFTGTTVTQTTLNWSDNSSNEVGFVIYRSTDGGTTYNFHTQTAANATSFTDTGLLATTTYFYQVYAVTEGALSGPTSNSVTTATPNNVSSTAAGGNWSAPATWVGGVIPTVNDNVIIADGATVTIDTTAVAYTVTVGTGGTPAVLQFDSATPRSLAAGNNVTVATNGTLQSATTGTVITHVLSVGGSLTNNGVLDLSTNGNTASAQLTFTTANNTTFSGTGATNDIRSITVNKGTTFAPVVELNASNFTVQGVATDVAGWLTLINGTFKVSGTFAGTSRVFPSSIYAIGATSGFWLNNPNYTVVGQAGGTTTANNGLLRVSQGTYNIGVGATDGMGGSTAGAQFIVEGGQLNSTGRIAPTGAITWTQTGGAVTVATAGNTVTNVGSFEITSTGSVFNMSGGTITLVQASTGTTPIDYRNNAVSTVTGGTLQVGTAATATNFNFRITGSVPALSINNTTNAKQASLAGTTFALGSITIPTGATLNLNNGASAFTLQFQGTSITNNGTINGSTTATRLNFLGTDGNGGGAQSYGGTGVWGTAGAPTAGFGIVGQTTINAPIITLRVNLFGGLMINSNNVTIGNGGTSSTVVQVSQTGNTINGGSFDVPPTFNTGTGGHTMLYLQEPSMRTTGNEVPPSRTALTMTVDNTSNVTLAGGNLTLTSTGVALTMTNGRIITGVNVLALSSSAATVSRTNGYVDGNFRKNYTAAASKVFEVGTANAFSPATVNVTAGTGDVTVRAVQGKQPNVPGTNALQRYWKVTEPGTMTATLTFQYLVGDVVGTEANYLAYKYTGTFVNPPGSTVNAGTHTINAPGQTTFTADWTAAEPSSIVATTDIRVNDARVAEPVAPNTVEMVFTVTLSQPATGNVSVNFTTADDTPGTGHAVAGTCNAGGDYTPTNGTVGFTSGQQVRTINVPICGDAVAEPDETFFVNLSSPSGGVLVDSQAVGTITGGGGTAGTFLISELRTRGPVGANDDFVELYNNTDSPLTVTSSDGSAGYGVFKMGADCDATPVLVGTIPNTTVIPARGHYLLTGSAYSLSNYGGANAAQGNASLTADIEDDRNVAVFSTVNPVNISSINRLDAVGFGLNTGFVCGLLREGTNLGPVGAQNIEYSFFRKECDFVSAVGCQAAGNPKDSNDASADFLFADTAGTSIAGTGGPRLGAPGPQRNGPTNPSPIRRDTSGIILPPLDSTVSTSSAPNRVRDFAPGDPNTSGQGTLSVRRRVQNTTAQTVTRLRFRIIELTTFPNPGGGQADLRAITSSPVVISNINDPVTCALTGTPASTPCQVTAQATTLESPPAQTLGGGYNSTLSLSIPGGIAPNASVDVNFTLGVVQSGTFRFYIIIEALP